MTALIALMLLGLEIDLKTPMTPKPQPLVLQDIPIPTKWIDVARSPTSVIAIDTGSIIELGPFVSVIVRTLTKDSNLYMVQQWAFAQGKAALMAFALIDARTGAVVKLEEAKETTWLVYSPTSPVGFVKDALDTLMQVPKK